MSTVRSEWYDSGSFANEVKKAMHACHARTGNGAAAVSGLGDAAAEAGCSAGAGARAGAATAAAGTTAGAGAGVEATVGDSGVGVASAWPLGRELATRLVHPPSQ